MGNKKSKNEQFKGTLEINVGVVSAQREVGSFPFFSQFVFIFFFTMGVS